MNLYCANCIAEREIKESSQLFYGAAVTILGGSALCLKCFWVKAELMKIEQAKQKEQLKALETTVEAMGKVKKSAGLS